MAAVHDPLVGRAAELERLEEALEGLAGGGGSTIVVTGDPGIGKTRLLAELRRRAEDRDMLVLAGAAAEFERDLPFGVWADALDAYAVSQDLGADPRLQGELATELADLLPSLGNGTAARAAASPDERYRTHRAARTLLELLAGGAPLVLILDDLHWADTASAELIAALQRRPPAAPVLVALALRPGRAPPRLAAAIGAPDVEQIGLEPLSEAEAAVKLEGLGLRLQASIFQQAGGNPFYLEQLARTVRTSGISEGDALAAAAGVPAAVAASLLSELDALSPGAAALLEAASVAGEPFEPELAAGIAELSLGDALDALDELLALDLVRPTQVPRRFVFRHPLVRRAVYESTPGGWRLAAHRRASEALLAAGAAATDRAHHVEQSAAAGDEAAIAVVCEAAAAASARAPAAAARWLGSALRLLPDADGRQVDLRIELASALRAQGDLERCRDVLLEAAERLGDDAGGRRAALIARCAAVEHWLGLHDDAHRRLERARARLGSEDTAEAAVLETELAVDALYAHDLERAVATGRAGLTHARALDAPAFVAKAAAALALAEVAQGLTQPAREHRDEAVRAIDSLSDEEFAPHLEALYYLGWAEFYLEHYDEAVAHAQRGMAIARKSGVAGMLVPLMLIQGAPLEMQGRLAEAIEICQTAVEVARVSAHDHYLFWALFELGWAHYYASHLEAAIEACEESARVGGRVAGGTMPSAGGGPGWAMAVAHFESGEHDRAREEMKAASGGPNMENWFVVERTFNWENVALAELALGNVDAAARFADRAEADAALSGLSLPATQAGRTRTAVLLAQERFGEAVDVASEAVRRADSIGATLQAAFGRVLLGRALAGAGERKEAIAVWRQAESDLDRCGSVRPRDEVRRELRRLGARAEPRGPAAGESGVDSLTKREREIAALVTDRMTNREIAGALFLSDKTVESHVRNIFMKLGVSSRVELARAFERARPAA